MEIVKSRFAHSATHSDQLRNAEVRIGGGARCNDKSVGLPNSKLSPAPFGFHDPAVDIAGNQALVVRPWKGWGSCSHGKMPVTPPTQTRCLVQVADDQPNEEAVGHDFWSSEIVREETHNMWQHCSSLMPLSLHGGLEA